MIYDLLLNCKNTTATMAIRTNDKTGTVMAIGFLKKKRKRYKYCSKNIKKSFLKKKYLVGFFLFFLKYM